VSRSPYHHLLRRGDRVDRFLAMMDKASAFAGGPSTLKSLWRRARCYGVQPL